MKLFPFSKEKKENNKDQSSPLSVLEKGSVSILDILAPSSVEVDFNF